MTRARPSASWRAPFRMPRLYGAAVHGYALVMALWGAAAASWLWLILESHTLMGPTATGPTMGLSLAPFLFFWIIMMIAMMFPSATPMVRAYHAINRRRESMQAGLPTAVFLLGYLTLWALAGIAAYIVARTVTGALAPYDLPASLAARLGGAIILAAGLYQLTPLKHFCLSKCGSPISFIMTSWRRGMAGAFAMGLEHGLYCLGCCWTLFALLFPLGIMNIAIMAAVTTLVFAEKIFRLRRRVAQVAGIALVAYGLTGMVFPAALPMFQSQPAMSGMNMKMDMKM